METIVVPIEFGVLFALPIVVFIYMLNNLYSPTSCLIVYIFLQITIAIAGRMIYG